MISGKKIYLTEVLDEHLEKFRTWRNGPELRQYFREYKDISPIGQVNWYNKINSDINQINFAIMDKMTKQLIGHTGLYYINWINRNAEWGGYIGDSKFRSKGYGSDSIRTVLKYGFSELNLNRIWIEVYSNNKLIPMYQHLGFIQEGILRQTYYHDGQYWNSHIMSILKEEYNG